MIRYRNDPPAERRLTRSEPCCSLHNTLSCLAGLPRDASLQGYRVLLIAHERTESRGRLAQPRTLARSHA